jgi:hypothetical protein
MNLQVEIPTIFTGQSELRLYCTDVVSIYVLSNGYVSINPFKDFDHFLNDHVERGLVRCANYDLIQKSDELLAFVKVISNRVLDHINYIIERHKPIKFFTLSDITMGISSTNLTYEIEVDISDFDKCIELLRKYK